MLSISESSGRSKACSSWDVDFSKHTLLLCTAPWLPDKTKVINSINSKLQTKYAPISKRHLLYQKGFTKRKCRSITPWGAKRHDKLWMPINSNVVSAYCIPDIGMEVNAEMNEGSADNTILIGAECWFPGHNRKIHKTFILDDLFCRICCDFWEVK